MYDSISGYAFMIGCQPGTVIGLTTKNKNIAFVDLPINAIQQHLNMIAWLTGQDIVVPWKQELLYK